MILQFFLETSPFWENEPVFINIYKTPICDLKKKLVSKKFWKPKTQIAKRDPINVGQLLKKLSIIDIGINNQLVILKFVKNWLKSLLAL